MAGVILRVVALTATFRRAGFAFSREAVDLEPEELTLGQLVQLVDEPMLAVSISEDGGETFRSISAEERLRMREVAAVHGELTREAFLAKLAAGEVELGDSLRDVINGGADTPPVPPAPPPPPEPPRELSETTAAKPKAVAKAKPAGD